MPKLQYTYPFLRAEYGVLPDFATGQLEVTNLANLWVRADSGGADVHLRRGTLCDVARWMKETEEGVAGLRRFLEDAEYYVHAAQDTADALNLWHQGHRFYERAKALTRPTSANARRTWELSAGVQLLPCWMVQYWFGGGEANSSLDVCLCLFHVLNCADYDTFVSVNF